MISLFFRYMFQSFINYLKLENLFSTILYMGGFSCMLACLTLIMANYGLISNRENKKIFNVFISSVFYGFCAAFMLINGMPTGECVASVAIAALFVNGMVNDWIWGFIISVLVSALFFVRGCVASISPVAETCCLVAAGFLGAFVGTICKGKDLNWFLMVLSTLILMVIKALVICIFNKFSDLAIAEAATLFAPECIWNVIAVLLSGLACNCASVRRAAIKGGNY